MTSARHLLDRRLLFVTGKGGVGKTTIAAGLARLAVTSGLRVLVCEMDAKGSLASALGCGPLVYEPTVVSPGLSAMAMNTEDSLREYLRVFIRIPLLGRIGPLARTFDYVADAAPGVKEILGVGKLCYEVRERHYDLVVVDADASGHVVSQVGAPRALAELVNVGLIRDQTAWMSEILDDPAQTGVVAVTTPEEMPVVETVELIGRLGEATQTEVAAVVANRVLPEPFHRSDEAAFVALAAAGRPALVRAAGPGAADVLDAAELAMRVRRNGAEQLGWLRANIAVGVPLVLVPELVGIGAAGVASAVETALGEELG